MIRAFSGLREMLPGSFVTRVRKCGKASCRCASGESANLHPQFLLSVLAKGKVQTFHIPSALAEEVHSQVELHRRFRQTETKIGGINLRRLLRRLQSPVRRGKG